MSCGVHINTRLAAHIAHAHTPFLHDAHEQTLQLYIHKRSRTINYAKPRLRCRIEDTRRFSTCR